MTLAKEGKGVLGQPLGTAYRIVPLLYRLIIGASRTGLSLQRRTGLSQVLCAGMTFSAQVSTNILMAFRQVARIR